MLLDLLKFDHFCSEISHFFSVIPFLCPCPEVLITECRLCRLSCTCTWNSPVDGIKRPRTFWLSMKFTFVFWSKNMCIREMFSKVGFFGNKSLGSLFLISTYLQLNNKTVQIPGL